jgi:nucleotide-binding universal stress UspA family protein
MPMRKILVATDFSPPARHAQQLAVDWARAFGASVTLLHAYAVPTYLFFDGSSYVPPPGVVAEIVASAAHGLAHAKTEATTGGVDVQTVTEEGAPADVIVRHAREHGFDLIVIGTHGRRGISRVVLGSVAERVVRTATVPVLTVHA